MRIIITQRLDQALKKKNITLLRKPARLSEIENRKKSVYLELSKGSIVRYFEIFLKPVSCYLVIWQRYKSKTQRGKQCKQSR